MSGDDENWLVRAGDRMGDAARYTERACALERGIRLERTCNRLIEAACALATAIAITLTWDVLTEKLLIGCFLGWFAARSLLRLLVYGIVLKPLLDKINREHPTGGSR